MEKRWQHLSNSGCSYLPGGGSGSRTVTEQSAETARAPTVTSRGPKRALAWIARTGGKHGRRVAAVHDPRFRTARVENGELEAHPRGLGASDEAARDIDAQVLNSEGRRRRQGEQARRNDHADE